MNDDYWTALAMRTHGGSFVRRMGALYDAADEVNRDLIKKTWHIYWDRSFPIGQRMKSEDEAKEKE